MFNILMVLTVQKMLIMTLFRIVPRPRNKPEVEVVAEVAIYRKHSQTRSQLGMISLGPNFSAVKFDFKSVLLLPINFKHC